MRSTIYDQQTKRQKTAAATTCFMSECRPLSATCFAAVYVDSFELELCKVVQACAAVDSEFEVNSLNFPGQVHRWRLTQLLQKGTVRAQDSLLNVRSLH